MYHKLSVSTIRTEPQRSGSFFVRRDGVKSLLRYNSLLCLCHLGLVLSLRSYTHTHTQPEREWHAGACVHVCWAGDYI